MISVEYTITDLNKLIYNFAFDYLNKKYIKVSSKNITTGVVTKYTYGVDYVVVDSTIELLHTVGAVGDVLRVVRETSTSEQIVSWNDASILKASDMSLAQVQQLHILEEYSEYMSTNSLSLDVNEQYDAKYSRIINILAPQTATDAVNRGYIDSFIGTLTDAQTSATLAQSWAIGDIINRPEGSSKYWAEQSKFYSGQSDTKFEFTGTDLMTRTDSDIVPRPNTSQNIGSLSRPWSKGYFDDVITKGTLVDVRAFGAVGDGVNDDTVAIQKAITYAQSCKATLFSPAGYNYKITSALKITKGINIDFSNSSITGYGAINVFEIGIDSAIYYATFKNISIFAGDTTVLRGIYGQVPWCVLDSVVVRGIEHGTRYFTIAGIETIQSWCSIYNNVRVSDTIGKGLYINGAANNINLDGITVQRTTGNAIDIYQGCSVKLNKIDVEAISNTAYAIVINLCYAVTLDNIYLEGLVNGIYLTGGTVGCLINNMFVNANSMPAHKSVIFNQCAGIEVNGFFAYGGSDSTALYMENGADVNRVWVNNVIYTSWSGTKISSYLTNVYCDYNDGSANIIHKFNHTFNGTTTLNGSVTTTNNQITINKSLKINNTIANGQAFISIPANGTHNVTVNLNDLSTFAVKIKYVFLPNGNPSAVSYIEKMITGYAYTETTLIGLTTTSVLSAGTSSNNITIGTPTFTTGRLLTIPILSSVAVSGHIAVEVLESNPKNLSV